ncbi:membrane protein [Pseudonocardia asaccharolytica DSM 44247 = NBRC 16224]|uniref:Membrane protein n=2 Tax=Pseudonocardia asaccharolytica TaxID=54010 RepID=A0A511D177_9PSEU|nr:membrane protein [Pseudonocardia asaccharolytica DSM 44247 = NBRC 16224]
MGAALAGAVGLGLLAVPAGAGAAPELPPVTAEELISSVMTADPGPFNGTVKLDNQLGLPALPQLPQAANGTSTATVWSDGDRKGRVSLPTGQTERTLVADGTTVWSWNSADRTVTKSPESEGPHRRPAADPTAAATEVVKHLRATSTVDVDGTAEVAGRSAYELVLAPAPTERTLLREVRVAVDAEKRVPLQLTVLATGSSDPALRLGFTDLTFGAQDPSLFTFTPPPGATVQERPAHAEDAKPGAAKPTVVGDGWDTVVIAKAPTGERAPELAALGKPVSGPWGNGREFTTAVGTAIVTDDGRIAVGAVPEQVLTEALTK